MSIASSSGFASSAVNGLHIESWAGETRVNLVRLASLIAFYGYHLMNRWAAPDDPSVAGIYHVQVTGLVLVWAIGSLALCLSHSRNGWPDWLKYGVTLWDLLLVATLLVLSGGPSSPLLPLLFLVIAAAPLRMSVALVCVAALGAVVVYVFLLGHHVFYVIGYERYYADSRLRLSRAQEVAYVLGLLIAGLLAGQAVRQAQRLAGDGKSEPRAKAAAEASREASRDSIGIGVGVAVLAVLLLIGLILAVTTAQAPQTTAPAANALWPAAITGCIAFVAALAAGIVSWMGQRAHSPEARP
jgi:hypothetical protein